MVCTRSSRVYEAEAVHEPVEAHIAASLVKSFPKEDVKDAVSPYEILRLSRIAENQARMEALGVRGKAAGLAAFFKVTRTSSSSSRVMANKRPVQAALFIRRSERIRGRPSPTILLEFDEEVHIKSRKVHIIRISGQATPIKWSDRTKDVKDFQISPVLMAQRCNSKGRGSLYDPIVGLCCHSCRQKKLCGEEECERCGNRDVSKPCLGKTSCSKCSSATGIFCRACLKVRYGQELEDVRKNPNWMCLHCFEAEGTDPFWICNSSICLTRRKLSPTGIAIFEARQQGFKSVAHYLRDKLMRCGSRGI